MSHREGGSSAARAAAALANIVKGVATGGLHGAAIGAVQSFLPELFKLAVIVLCTLILLPMLVLAALPNILFGYHSATAEDIVTLTDQAYNIDAAYRSVQNYSQAEIDRIVEELKGAYTDESGPQFDNVKVTEETDNTNLYWFIAITSAAHHQDLYAMDADSIRSMTVNKLQWTASIETSTTGAGYYDTDYGDITFSDASTPVVYYNQTDSRWGNKMYGKTGTIGGSGCGPTALAIAVASLTSSKVTPYDVAKWSVKNGYRCEGNGSYHSLIPGGGAHYGLTVTPIGNNAKKLVQALSDGKLVIAIMTKGHFTNGGHFIVLRGVTADGKILVADPASVKRSNQQWALGIITNEASRRARPPATPHY